MKKFCANCNKKQGFFSLNYKLKDGYICDDCISPFGISPTELNVIEIASANNFLETRTTAEIMDAIEGKNDVFAETRNNIFEKVPPGVLLKFDGGLGELSEEVFAYEDKAIIIEKGFAGTRLGKKEISMLFEDVVSVSLDEAVISKKNFIVFLQADGSEISIAYGDMKGQKAIALKEFVESRINKAM